MLGSVPIDVDEPPRHLSFDSLFNVRDLGGYRTADGRHTRWRTLYRADGLNRARATTSSASPRSACAPWSTCAPTASATSAARSRWTSCRCPTTTCRCSSRPGRASPSIPTSTGAVFLTQRYREMLDVGADAIAAALRVLADPRSYPAAFHCAAGKDRTGVLAALVLGVVGVPDDTIAVDYGLSRAGMASMVEWVRTEPAGGARLDGRPARRDARGAARAMHALLAELRAEFGDVAGYLDGHRRRPRRGRRARVNLLDDDLPTSGKAAEQSGAAREMSPGWRSRSQGRLRPTGEQFKSVRRRRSSRWTGPRPPGVDGAPREQVVDGGDRLGRAEEVALGEVAAQAVEGLGLVDRVDALGHRGDVERVGQGDELLGDGGVLAAGGHVLHEGAVDLEHVEVEVAQVAERREPGAEVVEGQLDARRPWPPATCPTTTRCRA